MAPINQQVHYMFSESQCIGTNGSKAHGPDAVIPMLHHYFEIHSAHEDNYTQITALDRIKTAIQLDILPGEVTLTCISIHSCVLVILVAWLMEILA